MNRDELIEKYRKELLGDEKRKAIIDAAMGSPQDQVDIKMGVRERNKEEWERVKAAEEEVKNFARQVLKRDFVARAEFPDDDLFDELMDSLPHFDQKKYQSAP